MANTYSRELKKEVCINILSGNKTAKEESQRIGAAESTIKGWLKKYKEDPLCFKRKDITGGIKEELQRTNGLMFIERASIMPNEKHMSELAFQKFLDIHPDFDASLLNSEADSVLKELLRIENEIYQKKSSELLMRLIPFYQEEIYGTMEDAFPRMRDYIEKIREVYNSTRNGKYSYEEYLNDISMLTAPVMHAVSFSIMQSSKSRAGAAFENALERLFDYINVKYETQVKEDEGKTKTDFIIPSMKQAKANHQNSAGIECQTTLKDRFRLTLGKNSSSKISCYLATSTGVGIFNKNDSRDITLEKIENIVEDQGVTLIVFPEVVEKIRLMLINNNESDQPQISKAKAEHLLNTIGYKIITYSEFFSKNIPALMFYWSRGES